ncbi:MAG: Vibrio phage [Pseudomonadota bacterium]|jgi:hypothetical protein
MSAIIHAADGTRVDLAAQLQPSIFLAIQDSGMTAQAYVNNLVPTAMGAPTVMEQLADQMGFHVGRNDKYGVRPSTLAQILNPGMQAGAITRDVDLGPRVFFPIFALSVMEKALRADNSAILGAYNRMVAVRDVIPGDTYERPIIDYTEAEKPRGAYTAQLSEPRIMVKATVSSKIYRIPSEAIGVEYSDQAARALGLDFLMTGFARRAEQAAIDRVYDYVYSFLNGDPDMDMPALSAVQVKNSAGTMENVIRTAQSFDASIATAGTLSQEAWVAFLYNRSKVRTINYVVTDLKGALAIEKRTGRPNVQGDNATSKRIDTLENVTNPMWPDKVDIFIVDDPRWPANLILGLDTRYGVHHVSSTALDYQGAEQWAIRRSTKLRFDLGETASRMYDDAWSGLSLTV